MVFDIHVFVCCNQRSGNERLSCGEEHGLALVTEFKKQLKAVPNMKLRANRSGCLGICDFGPTIAIYPEGVFYVGVKTTDVAEIVESHIKGGKVVDRLLLKK